MGENELGPVLAILFDNVKMGYSFGLELKIRI